MTPADLTRAILLLSEQRDIWRERSKNASNLAQTRKRMDATFYKHTEEAGRFHGLSLGYENAIDIISNPNSFQTEAEKLK